MNGKKKFQTASQFMIFLVSASCFQHMRVHRTNRSPIDIHRTPEARPCPPWVCRCRRKRQWSSHSHPAARGPIWHTWRSCQGLRWNSHERLTQKSMVVTLCHTVMLSTLASRIRKEVDLHIGSKQIGYFYIYIYIWACIILYCESPLFIVKCPG